MPTIKAIAHVAFSAT